MNEVLLFQWVSQLSQIACVMMFWNQKDASDSGDKDKDTGRSEKAAGKQVTSTGVSM